MSRSLKPDADRPLEAETSDLFRFVEIAKRLAPAVLNTLETGGVVIGIEGPWGSGKTTLLNFLRLELEKCRPAHIHLISIAPWLSGDESNLVSSLLSPIAEILDHVDQLNVTRWTRFKKRGTRLGALVRTYGAKTGRTLAPAVRLAESVLPGAKVAGDALEVSSKYLENSKRQLTTAEIKNDICARLAKLNVGFVVILDDLDRVEPKQAVEVVRLVRSVADFPNITYIMCYDRTVLSQALQNGLQIADGESFLQKIVQLSFAIPLPEPFDLRELFFKESSAIFEEVTGFAPQGDLLEDLKRAVEKDGAALHTPREVKLALNSLRFLYPNVKDDVYFPDVCRLHLIKTTNPSLYRWLEEYLSNCSVLMTSDATISDYDRTEMGKRLKDIFPSNDAQSRKSIWHLWNFIPGVIAREKPDECVFSVVNTDFLNDLIRERRLGSPIHYRYYFALTYPKTVMSESDFNKLLNMSRNDPGAFSAELVALSKSKRSSGRSWFEHVLDRLNAVFIKSLDVATLEGLVHGISDAMDGVLVEDSSPRAFSISLTDVVRRVVRELLNQLKACDRDAFAKAADSLISDCKSLSWIIGFFFRDEIRNHGYAGGEASPSSCVFDTEAFKKYIDILQRRSRELAANNDISCMPHLASYLYGWKEISEGEAKDWATSFISSDERFLFLLDKLRSWAMSDKVFYPLHRSSVSAFLDWDETIERLKSLSEGNLKEKVDGIEAAIALAKY